MNRRKRHQERVKHERWLVSYADFITLLFAFFVVLYASSQADKGKMGQLGAAIGAAFQDMGVFQAEAKAAARNTAPLHLAPVGEDHANPVIRADLTGLQNTLERVLAPEIDREEVALRMGPEGLVISLREVGFFDSGSARLRPEAEGAFGRIAGILLAGPCDLRIEGHTDNVPIHTAQFHSNWELSTARSTEVVRQLIETYGFLPQRLSAAGFAEYHPAASNRDDDGRRLNRRIDLVVLGQLIPRTSSNLQ